MLCAGYIVDGGVSRVPYGGYRILDHLRQFLHMRNVSLINEVESYIIRHVSLFYFYKNIILYYLKLNVLFNVCLIFWCIQ